MLATVILIRLCGRMAVRVKIRIRVMVTIKVERRVD